VTSPFYDGNDRMSVMLISVSAGIMSGDSQEIGISVNEGAELDVTSQAFEKIHRMEKGGFARRDTRIAIGKCAALTYSPLPTIPFRDSAFKNQTEVRLADSSSRFFQSEIISCGRVARGERFEFREYRSLTKVYEGDSLIYSDNAVYVPDNMDMNGFCLFEGYSHLGSFLLINQCLSAEQAEALREAVYSLKNGVGGLSLTGHGDYCVRALADGSEPLILLGEAIHDVLFR
jgi:urease accessory protein